MHSKQTLNTKEDVQDLVIDHDFDVHTTFTMHVGEFKSDTVGKGDGYFVKVIMGFDGVSTQDIIDHACAGSGLRVDLATNLRGNCSLSQIERLTREGFAVHVNDRSKIVPRTMKEIRMETIAHYKLMKKTNPKEFETMLETLQKIRDNK